jgi:hypothetical protein
MLKLRTVAVALALLLGSGCIARIRGGGEWSGHEERRHERSGDHEREQGHDRGHDRDGDRHD